MMKLAIKPYQHIERDLLTNQNQTLVQPSTGPNEPLAAYVLRKREAAKLIGISIATLDRLRAAGTFVRPIRLGEQAIGFLRHDLEAWIASRPLCSRFTQSLVF
jgi:prophage regulatory protein